MPFVLFSYFLRIRDFLVKHVSLQTFPSDEGGTCTMSFHNTVSQQTDFSKQFYCIIGRIPTQSF
jgi:hypothetical protein